MTSHLRASRFSKYLKGSLQRAAKNKVSFQILLSNSQSRSGFTSHFTSPFLQLTIASPPFLAKHQALYPSIRTSAFNLGHHPRPCKSLKFEAPSRPRAKRRESHKQNDAWAPIPGYASTLIWPLLSLFTADHDKIRQNSTFRIRCRFPVRLRRRRGIEVLLPTTFFPHRRCYCLTVYRRGFSILDLS